MKGASLLAVFVLAAAPALAQPSPKVDASVVESYVRATWSKAPPDWQSRVAQDETQRICTQLNNAPPPGEAEKIMARERAAIVYPADGKLMGDWKNGEKLAESGYGGRFTDYPARQPNGGNCYACHQLAKAQVSYGTLGPSLLEYGKIRKYSEADTKAVYERIYNPHAAIACANMPRLGASKFLTIDQIRDLVAYVMSPDSPVNK